MVRVIGPGAHSGSVFQLHMSLMLQSWREHKHAGQAVFQSQHHVDICFNRPTAPVQVGSASQITAQQRARCHSRHTVQRRCGERNKASANGLWRPQYRSADQTWPNTCLTSRHNLKPFVSAGPSTTCGHVRGEHACYMIQGGARVAMQAALPSRRPGGEHSQAHVRPSAFALSQASKAFRGSAGCAPRLQ